MLHGSCQRIYLVPLARSRLHVIRLLVAVIDRKLDHYQTITSATTHGSRPTFSDIGPILYPVTSYLLEFNGLGPFWCHIRVMPEAYKIITVGKCNNPLAVILGYREQVLQDIGYPLA